MNSIIRYDRSAVVHDRSYIFVQHFERTSAVISANFIAIFTNDCRAKRKTIANKNGKITRLSSGSYKMSNTINRIFVNRSTTKNIKPTILSTSTLRLIRKNKCTLNRSKLVIVTQGIQTRKFLFLQVNLFIQGFNLLVDFIHLFIGNIRTKEILVIMVGGLVELSNVISRHNSNLL